MRALKFTSFVFFLLMASVSSASVSNPCLDKVSAKMEMALISSNIANHSTTRLSWGGQYQPFVNIRCAGGACQFDQDQSVRRVYEPSHPHADELGFVEYPSVDLLAEMEKMIAASRRHDEADVLCSKQ